MAHDYHELKEMTLTQLRELAKGIEHEAVQGHSQMNKDHLLPAVCTALGIETHEHHDVVGIDRGKLKAQIRELKDERAKALQAHDHEGLKVIRRKIHRCKRQIRAATV
jgi:hypothetical protein